MHWFFFGSLLDRDVLDVVLGRASEDVVRRPGTLRGYRKLRVADESYPALRADAAADARADGVVFSGFSDADMNRVCYFEGDEFELRPLPVDLDDGGRVDALTFTATEKLLFSDQVWTLADWQREHKAGFLPLAREWMDGYGGAAPQDLEAQWQAGLRRLGVRSAC